MRTVKWMPLSADANMWLSLVFLAFGVYTPTPVQYQLNKRAVAKDMGINIQCGGASVGPLPRSWLTSYKMDRQHCQRCKQTSTSSWRSGALNLRSCLANNWVRTPGRIRWTESRLRCGHTTRAPTLEQATLETASQMAVVPQGHWHRQQATNWKAIWQWSQPTRAWDPGQATNFSVASWIAVMPQGHWHCGQASFMNSKPQRSWPTRVLDIAGKLPNL